MEAEPRAEVAGEIARDPAGRLVAVEPSPGACVVVVEPHPLVRTGIAGLLRRVGLDAVEAPDPAGAIDAMRGMHPDVILVSLNLPAMPGAQAVRLLRRVVPRAGVVVLADRPEDPQVIDALGAGACGAILRSAGNHEMVAAIRAAADGESALSPQIASRLVRRLQRRHREVPSPAALTSRELEVLRLLSRGWDNARIAEALYVGRGTVKHHISRILEKLGVDNRIQAAVEAVQRGLVDG